MFLVGVVVELEVEVSVGVDMRMQLPMMGLDGLIKEEKNIYIFPHNL